MRTYPKKFETWSFYRKLWSCTMCFVAIQRHRVCVFSCVSASGIRQLQLMLLKVSLILGVEIHVNVEFTRLLEPPAEQTDNSECLMSIKGSWVAATHSHTFSFKSIGKCVFTVYIYIYFNESWGIEQKQISHIFSKILRHFNCFSLLLLWILAQQKKNSVQPITSGNIFTNIYQHLILNNWSFRTTTCLQFPVSTVRSLRKIWGYEWWTFCQHGTG